MQTENASDPSLTYTPEVARLTAPIYERIRNVIPEIEWPVHAPYVAAINRLKAERNAIVMAHNYQTPEIFHGVGDFTGDSLALARKAIEDKGGSHCDVRGELHGGDSQDLESRKESPDSRPRGRVFTRCVDHG